MRLNFWRFTFRVFPNIWPRRADKTAHVRAPIVEPPKVKILARTPEALHLETVGELDRDVRKGPNLDCFDN